HAVRVPAAERAPKWRLRVPAVALTAEAVAATASSATTSRVRSMAGRKPARRSRVTPPTAATVLPAAIPRALASGTPAPNALTASAPRATPGQNPRPRRRSTARANPDEGQTGATLPGRDPTASPSRANR